MRDVKAYLRKSAGAVWLFLLFGAVFLTVFALSGLPASAVGYAMALCAFFGLAYMTADGVRYVRRARSLRGALEHPAQPAALPAPADGVERDYQAMITALRERLASDQAAQQARYADAMDYFTAWTHQIKTPIAGMRLLLKDEPPDRGELASQLFRVEQYTEMALGYLRLDGGSDLLIARYELDPIIRRAVKKYAAMFIRRGVALDYGGVAQTALTDEKWLGFVLEQLLSNALKFTAGGAVSITARPGPVLIVRDTGIGIAAADLPMVFQKGYTGFNGRIDGRSTGIGLYLCKRVCDILGHGIRIQSEPGEGTAVYLDLSAAKLEVE